MGDWGNWATAISSIINQKFDHCGSKKQRQARVLIMKADWNIPLTKLFRRYNNSSVKFTGGDENVYISPNDLYAVNTLGTNKHDLPIDTCHVIDK